MKKQGLTAERLQAALRTQTEIGREIVVLEEVDSTNTQMKKGFADRPSGFVLLAHRQTAGRGRLGRSFVSPEQDGIYCSILVRPPLAAEKLPLLTIGAAVAVCRAIEQTCGFTPGIKWVNDILMQGKKLCGILTEGAFAGTQIGYAVVGIGVNLRFDPAAHPDLCRIAGGLADFAQTMPDPVEFTAAMLRAFEGVYAQLCAGQVVEVLEAYRERMLGVGEAITVFDDTGSWEAVCLGVDPQGQLLVTNTQGIHTLRNGEISIRLVGQRNKPAVP